MPIYDYACRACGHVVEVIHGIHDPGPHFCPNCGVEGSMRKRIVTSAVHFKGSGWAKKDRSTAASSRSKGSGPSSTSTASAGASTGTDTASTAEPSGSTEPAPVKASEPAARKSGEGD